MIKKYNHFNEGLRDHLKGPSVEELVKNFGDISIDDVLIKSVEIDYYFPIVKYAVEHGADVDYREGYALRKASSVGNFELVKYLVEQGANVNITDKYKSPLVLAVPNMDSWKIVKILLKHGATDKNGECLEYACSYGKTGVVEVLVENGADVNVREGIALKKAIYYGRYDIVEYLLQHSAIPNKNMLRGGYSDNLSSKKYENIRNLVRQYMKTNEGLLDKLQGPSKEEAWKQVGFDRTFETPEEYFVYLTDGIEIVSPNGLYYQWIKDGKEIFEQFPSPEKLIFMKYSIIQLFYKVFDMNFFEIEGFRIFNKFIHDMFKKYFKDDINIDEYQIRIEYNR